MISIVVPAYNEEKCLAQCIEALLRQTVDQPYEAIIVDNNSTDRTAVIAERYVPRIRLVREGQKGRGAARRTGIGGSDECQFVWHFRCPRCVN